MATGLIPSAAVLDGWGSMDDALGWAGIDPGLARPFFRQLGDPDFDSLPVLAMIPTEVTQTALQRSVRGVRQLNSIEIAQLTLLVNALKANFGQQGITTESTMVAVAATPAAVSTSISTTLKLKLNQIIDQGCDLEVEQLPHTELVKYRRRYVLATAATLDRYSASFKARIHEYPNVWHLAAQADIRCRSEFWIRELRRQEAFFAAHPQLSSFSPKQPWNNVIKISATHTDSGRKSLRNLHCSIK